MAVAYEASYGIKTANNTTQTHTNVLSGGSNSNRIALVYVLWQVSGATTLGATLNGNTMTGLGQFAGVSGYQANLFYIAGDANVNSGASSNTIVTTTTTSGVRFVAAAVFSGVDVTGTPQTGYANQGNYNSSPYTNSVANSSGNLIANFVIAMGGNAGSGGAVVLTPTSPAVNTVGQSQDFDAADEWIMQTSTSTGGSIQTSADLPVEIQQAGLSLHAATGGFSGRFMTMGMG